MTKRLKVTALIAGIAIVAITGPPARVMAMPWGPVFWASALGRLWELRSHRGRST